MTDKPRVLFLAWAPYSPRLENISKRIDSRICLISYKFKRKLYSPIKYPVLFVKTIMILRKEKPDVVVCQTPPIFCPLAVLMSNFTSKKIRLVIDAHTQTFRSPWSYFKRLNRIVITSSDLIIVSTTEIQEMVVSLFRKKALVLEDRIPEFEHQKNNSLCKYERKTNVFQIAVISSFADDEPISSVIKAASELPNIFFYITGNKSGMPKYLLKNGYRNITFTGFLQYDEYITLLHLVDAVMVLTDREDSMLSGAYDAVSIEKPLISYASKPIQRYFSKGTVYVNNSPLEIKKAILQVQAEKEILTEDMRQLKLQRKNEWEHKFELFKSLIQGNAEL